MSAHPSIPTATYRLQFHRGFTFRDAKAILPYLHELGISHLYASPIFEAAPGSLHGYDICDHNRLNPELGSPDDFDALVAELHRLGMNQVLDFVPNHMGIAEAVNTWWMDVLENGPSSPYARFFDIDWKPVKRELENKVLLPILGDQYGRVLESGDLKLAFEEGSFFLDYYGRRLPIAPGTTRPLLEAARRRLGNDGFEDEATVELESIMVAVSHLPERTETDPARIAERYREKGVIKSRLARLCAEYPGVNAAIAEVVAEMQGGGPGRDFDAYDALLNAQPYRVAYWRVAAEEINYRRFFDINNLAAIRMELPEVFDATHRFVLELIAKGAATGLRIDHIDGLWDPRGYLVKLQERVAQAVGASPREKPLYLLVEKILGKNERLRADWPIHGTTGYEAAVALTAVQVDPGAERAFTRIYSKFIDRNDAYGDLAHRGKLLTMRVSMASEINALGQMLSRLSETSRRYRDFTLNALTAVIREVIACFPVYRTYLTADGTIPEEDYRIVFRAIASARRRNPAIERTAFEFLRDMLLGSAENRSPVDEEARLAFALKFQQCTGPIMAKGLEDTAFYIFNRLAALNEVGGEPGVFGMTVEVFHQQNRERLAGFPHSMVTTSTHDTKRSEDVRARLAALSELPQLWGRSIRRWHTANREHRREIAGEFAPDANEEYLLYQTLLGTWPLHPMSPPERQDYIRRIREYMQKALHEAKVNSSWIEPNVEWDEAVGQFVEAILTPGRRNRFLKSFEPFAQRIAELGAVNSLAQLVLKLTIPGVPDIYQGQELWDFSLVDPDNRRPVDYAERLRRLEELRQPPTGAELFGNWRDGRVKMALTHKLLAFRRDNPALFGQGSYTPIAIEGGPGAEDGCIAFHRLHEGREILVLAPRLTARLGTPPVGECWGEARAVFDLVADWTDLFTGRVLRAGETVFLKEAFRELPVAVYAAP